MKRISLLCLILLGVWAGLCSAQTAKKYYLYDGLFFEGMPPGVSSSDVSSFMIHKGEEDGEMIELKLLKGRQPAAGYRNYATPVDEVPQAAFFLASARMKEGRKLPVGAVKSLEKEKWLGQPFPEFKVNDTQERVWTRADIIGRPMVLNFWYTGCGPCRREMPDLNRWMERFPNVTYLATTFDSAAQIQRIVEETPFRFIQIADELFFFNLFKVTGMPVMVLVDKKGMIRYIEEGTGAAKLRYMGDLLARLAAE